jgi:hypothetical protein
VRHVAVAFWQKADKTVALRNVRFRVKADMRRA